MSDNKGLKVTITYEGAPGDVDHAIYGEVRNTQQLEAEVNSLCLSNEKLCCERDVAQSKVLELESIQELLEDTCHNLADDLATARKSLSIEQRQHGDTRAGEKFQRDRVKYLESDLSFKQTEARRLEEERERFQNQLRNKTTDLFHANEDKNRYSLLLSQERAMNHKLRMGLMKLMMNSGDVTEASRGSLTADEAAKAIEELLKPGEFDFYPANLVVKTAADRTKINLYYRRVGNNKIQTIKMVRENWHVAGTSEHMGLKEAKELVEWCIDGTMPLTPSIYSPIGVYTDEPEPTGTIGDLIREKLGGNSAAPVYHDPIKV